MTIEEIQEGQILLIDKPLGWTSFQVVNKIKWLILKKYNMKKIKIGHAGTLDPLAIGLLVICTGKFTKKIQEIQDCEKEYSGHIQLGAETPSYDLETPICKTFPKKYFSIQDIKECAKSFEGHLKQIPPIYSAIKQQGRRSYDLAREGVELEMKEREVFIHSFKVLGFANDEVHFNIECSKGTYIRSIAYDFGKRLNSGAYLKNLKRERIGDYKVQNAYDINNVTSIFS